MTDLAWKVSAIIPSYNRADLLPDTIVSILAQTTPVHEIIVVDDGSTDNTAAVVESFGSRVRYVRIGNSGAPVARNIGALLAKGDWLWFCDSDDLWKPIYAERCRALAASPTRPGFIFGDFRLVANGEWCGPSKFSTAPKGFWSSLDMETALGGAIIRQPLYRQLIEFQPVFHSTIMISRELFLKVGGYDRTFARAGSEDFEFTLRCVSHAPIGVVQEPLVGIRRHQGNFSGNHLRALLGEVDILRHAKAHHPAAREALDVIDQEIERRSQQAIDEAFALNDYEAVGRIAQDIDRSSIDPRLAFKVFLSRLPPGIRSPIVSAARIKNRKTAAIR